MQPKTSINRFAIILSGQSPVRNAWRQSKKLSFQRLKTGMNYNEFVTQAKILVYSSMQASLRCSINSKELVLQETLCRASVLSAVFSA